MIDEEVVDNIIAAYEKHGWILRRILLTEGSRASLGPKTFAGVPVLDSLIDAAWFSRPPGVGPVAWEVRFLGEIPFSLIEYADEESSSFETALKDVEARLTAAISSKRAA